MYWKIYNAFRMEIEGDAYLKKNSFCMLYAFTFLSRGIMMKSIYLIQGLHNWSAINLLWCSEIENFCWYFREPYWCSCKLQNNLKATILYLLEGHPTFPQGEAPPHFIAPVCKISNEYFTGTGRQITNRMASKVS